MRGSRGESGCLLHAETLPATFTESNEIFVQTMAVFGGVDPAVRVELGGVRKGAGVHEAEIGGLADWCLQCRSINIHIAV